MTASLVFVYRQGLVLRLHCVGCGAEHYGPKDDLCPRCAASAFPPAYISPREAVGLIAERRVGR
jgi:hypothetical protein